MAGLQKSFRATLERGAFNLEWTMVRIPFDASKVWGSRGQIKIKGEINGFPFRTSLFPDGKGDHFLVVNRKMQAGAKAKAGDTAKFVIEPDTAERTALLPPEFAKILKGEPALRKWFAQLSHSNRDEIGKWICDVKSDAARARRADQMAERLISTMDAEIELPPALRIAFENDPVAYEAWKKSSAGHRRQQLLAVFYYRDPQSRARRVAKLFAQLREKSRS
jgi:uncharacterized protein YdeI (YjbR/CyaY-like superfamily)